MTGIRRKYPVGIQSFETIRKDGYWYVDKTPLIYKMITEGKPYFLSRPRRFGKSLLVSTLAAVFEGRRDLFEAFTTEDGIEQPQLFIAQTNWRWEKQPAYEGICGITEEDYHSLLYTLLVAFGAEVRVEEPSAKGQSDLVLLMPKGIYVMEIKYNDSAETALAQIEAKGYAEKYLLDGRPVTKVGIAFNSEERNITEWKTIAQ